MSALPHPSPAQYLDAPARGRSVARMRAFAAALRGEWRQAPATVRVSVTFLLIFYLFAAASPMIAPYDPANQYRNLPDCPPMRLHLSPPSQWAHGFFFAYPMKLAGPARAQFRPG